MTNQRSSSSEEEKTVGQVLLTEQDISVEEEEEEVLLTDQGFSSSEEEKMESQVLSMEQGSSSSYCFLAFFNLFIRLDSKSRKACSESKAIKWYVDKSQFKTDIICIPFNDHTHMTSWVLRGLVGFSRGTFGVLNGTFGGFWGGTLVVLGGLLEPRVYKDDGCIRVTGVFG